MVTLIKFEVGLGKMTNSTDWKSYDWFSLPGRQRCGLWGKALRCRRTL